MDRITTLAQAPFAGLPVWVWIAIAVVVVVILLAAVASRRKRRQAVIKTRIG